MRTVDKIQEILDSKHITAAKMMRDLGFSSGLFSQWKSGKQEVSLEKIIKIADYLGCSIDYLLSRTNDKNTIAINNQAQTFQGTQINSVSKPEKDTMEEEFIAVFKNLSIMDKVAVMQFAFEKIGKRDV